MRVPFFASIGDAGSNILNSFKRGYNFNPNPFKGITGEKLKSLGGFATSRIGGVAIGATAGAAVGSSVAAQSDIEPTIGAAVGGSVGAAAGLFAIPAAGAAFRTGEAIVGLAGKGIKAVATSEALGSAATSAAVGAGTVGMYGAARLANATQKFLGSVVKYDKEAGKLMDVKLTAKGKALMVGSSVIAGMAGAFNEMQRTHMGTVDTYMTSMTPRIPSMPDNAGATGDLVFALNANRRG